MPSQDEPNFFTCKLNAVADEDRRRREEPRNPADSIAYLQAGAETRLVSPKSEYVRGWNFMDWGDKFLSVRSADFARRIFLKTFLQLSDDLRNRRDDP